MHVLRTDFSEPTGETRRRLVCRGCGARRTIKEPPAPGYKPMEGALSASAASKVIKRAQAADSGDGFGPLSNDHPNVSGWGPGFNTLRKG
jgi:hypothetical protein